MVLCIIPPNLRLLSGIITVKAATSFGNDRRTDGQREDQIHETTRPLPWDSAHWLVQCTLGCHWLTQCTLGHWMTQRIQQGTQDYQWKNLIETAPHWNATGETDHSSLHWTTTGETVTAHTCRHMHLSIWQFVCCFVYVSGFSHMRRCFLIMLQQVHFNWNDSYTIYCYINLV